MLWCGGRRAPAAYRAGGACGDGFPGVLLRADAALPGNPTGGPFTNPFSQSTESTQPSVLSWPPAYLRHMNANSRGSRVRCAPRFRTPPPSLHRPPLHGPVHSPARTLHPVGAAGCRRCASGLVGWLRLPLDSPPYLQPVQESEITRKPISPLTGYALRLTLYASPPSTAANSCK